MTIPGEAWSALPGETWAEGVLAGTGVAGALLYGTPRRHSIAFAHERFFVPANSRQPAPHLASSLPAVRAALDAGDDMRAADIVDDALRAQGWDPDVLIWTDPLGPVARVDWEPSVDEWVSYRRDVSLVDGNAGVQWVDAKGVRAGIRIRAVRGVAGFDVELWSERPVRGRLNLRGVDETGSDASTVLPVDYSDRVHTALHRSDEELRVSVHAHGPNAEDDAVVDASLQASHPQLPHPRGGWDVIATPEGTTFRVRVGLPDATSLRLDDAATLIERSTLTLGGARREDEPTESTWAAARGGDPAAERRAFELAYAAGRRNIIISTGELPPTLQGVWQGTWAPAWSADYTLNGNVQLGTLAAVLWTGTPELMQSIFRLTTQFASHYRSNARNVFGLGGMMLPARMTTHGHANHFLRDYPHQFWVGNGPWLLRLAADYIQVTGDRAIIDDWLWDYATEILQFSVDFVRDGGGHLNPSYSPENTPAGHDNPLVKDASSDIAAIRDGLNVGVWLARLRSDDARADEWERARTELPPYPISAGGALAEWSPQWPENVAHRHASQLQGLWYEPDEVLVSQLRRAAAQTVRDKLSWRAEDPSGPPGNMEMAFGLTSIALAAVAVGDAEAAYLCALWLARDHFTPALTTTHDAGGIFNLDASGALPAIVAAMLLRSSSGRLDLLPALPTAWPSGVITGLQGRGSVRVARLEWGDLGLRASLELPAEGAWLRPDGIVVTFPSDGHLDSVNGIVQVDSRTARVAPGVAAVDLTFTYAGE